MNKQIEKNDRVIEKYEREIYGLKQLIEISKALNSTLDNNILIESLLLTCMGQMQLIKAGIFLQKEIDHDVFVLHRNYKGFELDHSSDFVIPCNSDLIRYMEKDFRCYELKELGPVNRDDIGVATLKSIMPCLIVPLKGIDKLNGIIILGERISEEPFQSAEKEFLMHIASLAGSAIRNAQLYELAITDMMTKLKLHHFFQTSLIEERERAVREHSPLSLIMVDIDHFKKFNDTYGHTCGDFVLKQVASIIVESVRQIDLASRYGGEEFAVILPDTDLEAAAIVAERIRKHIDNEKIYFDDKQFSVTVSVGVTEYDPDMDKDNIDIIDRADKALYQSKNNGRNKVSIMR